MRLHVAWFVALAACGSDGKLPPPHTAPPATPEAELHALVFGDPYQRADAEMPILPPAPADCPAWHPTLARAESHLVAEINQRRRAGVICGSRGYFAPTTPLAVDYRLQCAARAHSVDMGSRNFVGHRNPDGDNYVVRARRAGFRATYIGENIAAHLRDPVVVVRGFVGSDGHCANLMNPAFRFIGVGLHETTSSYWTVLFGLPVSGR